jgi:glycosyltransferase involved in cell wall biosynthesis
MASYDALALTTLGNEGLPLVLLEAMSYGLPLLTTAVAAIPDCCSENADAIMVSPDLDGVRYGLRELARRLECGQFSPERQQRFYEATFSYTAMSRQWLECLSNPVKFFSS